MVCQHIASLSLPCSAYNKSIGIHTYCTCTHTCTYCLRVAGVRARFGILSGTTSSLRVDETAAGPPCIKPSACNFSIKAPTGRIGGGNATTGRTSEINEHASQPGDTYT